MSDANDKIEAFKALMVEILPARIVTREYRDFSERAHDDLTAGIYTLLCKGLPKFGALVGSPAAVSLFLLGQFKLDEDAGGDAVEAAELAMIDEVTDLLRTANDRYPTVPTITPIDISTSAQLDRPYGWIAVQLEMSWTKKCTT